MKKEKILSNTLFIFGIALLVFSFAMLVFNIYDIVTFDWRSVHHEEDFILARSYFILEFVTVVFKILLAAYAIYSWKHVDEALNPLFTFTVLYFIFVVIQTLAFFLKGDYVANIFNFINTVFDIIVVTFFFIVTLILKVDDWKELDERKKLL